MAPLFEPGPGTLEALEEEFSRRLAQHLRAIVRGAKRSVFDDGKSSPLVELGCHVVELRLKLHAGETNTWRVAREFGLAYLQFSHDGKSDDPAASTNLARALLASMAGVDRATEPHDGDD
jgi:hypothetical protein